jgi:hypothetical protein
MMDPDQLDRGSLRLIPLLYRNLKAHEVEDQLMDSFRGVYRFTWYKNHMLFHTLQSILSIFNKAGIRIIVLKGAALTLLYYRDYGLRPMEDLDILIPEKDVIAAIEILRELGWRPQRRLPKTFTEEYVSSTKGYRFNNEKGEGIDLHWHVLLEACYRNADADFWNGIVPINLNDIKTYALNETDQLFHVCVHGSMKSLLPTIRWIADAVLILRSSKEEIDWNRLVRQADKHRLVLPLENTLNYLHYFSPFLIPSQILEDLQHMPMSRIELLENKVRTRYPVFIKYILKEWFCYLRNRQLESGKILHFQCIGFMSYLRYSLSLDHIWQVPVYGTLRLVRLFIRMIMKKDI